VVRDVVEGRVGQARERAVDTWDKLEKVFEDRVQKALVKLGVPGRDDLNALTHRVERLTEELRKANGGSAPKTAKAPRKATAPAATKPAKTPRKAAKATKAPKAAKAPTLVDRVREVDARVGRCRVIELQPNSYADALYNSHLDDNNRRNPDGEGWVIRSFMQLSDNPGSYMILREDIDDPSTETRLALPAGAQLVVDSERMWHSVWHVGDEPRYCLINSFESGPALEKWIFERNPVTRAQSGPLAADAVLAGEAEAQERRAARTQYYGYDPSRVYSEA